MKRILKLSILVFIIFFSLLLTSCPPEAFEGILYSNNIIFLIEVDSEGQSSTRTIFDHVITLEEGITEEILDSVLLEKDGDVKIVFDRKMFEKSEDSTSNNFYFKETIHPIYSCGEDPAYEGEWPVDYEKYSFGKGEIWLKTKDEKSFATFDSSWLPLKIVENIYYENAEEILRDVVVLDGNFYFLYRDTYDNYFVRICDTYLQNTKIIDLDTTSIKSNFILGTDSISVISVDKSTNEEDEVSYNLVENVLSSDGTEKKIIIDDPLLPDLNETIDFYLSKKDFILFIHDNIIYCYDSVEGKITGTMDYANDENTYVCQDSNKQIIIANYDDEVDDPISGVEELAVKYYDCEFNLLNEVTIPLSGKYKKRVLGFYMNSNDKLNIATFGSK